MRLITCIIFFCIISHVSSSAESDSLKQKVSSLLFTPRFNTLNMAPVSGNIVNRHVNLDLTLVYNRNRFTWTTVAGVDLEDGRSEMNYFLSNVRYKINLSKSFAVSP